MVADEVYGSDGSFWFWLEKTGKQPYALSVSKKQSFVLGWDRYRADEILQLVEPEQWQRLSCGSGTKGERYYDWARVEVNCDRSEGFQRWLVFRRSFEEVDSEQRISYYQVFALRETNLENIVQVIGRRWCIEECFKLAKSQLGLGDYEVRSWHGWHRHMTLVLAAQAFLTILRTQVEPKLEPHSQTDSHSPPLNLTGSMAVFKASRGL